MSGREAPLDRIAPPRPRRADLRSQGEPERWAMGGALALGIVLIVGFLLLVLWNGVTTFWPRPLVELELVDGSRVAGEPTRSETFEPSDAQLGALAPAQPERVAAAGGSATRVLYRVGNFDLYGEDFRWVSDFEVAARTTPADLWFFERVEWGPFVGRFVRLRLGDEVLAADALSGERLRAVHRAARQRFEDIRSIERSEIGAVNRRIEERRLSVRAVELAEGGGSAAHRRAEADAATELAELAREYDGLAARAAELRRTDAAQLVTLADVSGREKELPLSSLTRFYAPNELGAAGKLGVYLGRWREFLTEEPREANTEGGVLPAIFGTAAMTLLMVLVVTPFGVITALYLREYARQGRLVSIVRISVNNLAGVPSIVYGVFGLGFFAYTLGVRIDELFYAERLPSPTFGTGGLLWASLTLALLTVPVVIVATEEALAAVPRSVREGSLACGASKWQTIRRVVLPQAMPGIMTGLILAMARGAGEVAPLMLVGVVKLAPELPVDGTFPFVHFERSFMHLGFHIYDVGFQSRNSEAGKPMVFVTTLLLIALIFAMNVTAIGIRARLKRRFAGAQF
ncbi:MAG TPA: phosphate ABC transporter permease PstA [Myxococcota bacterium]|nr:phosphate ABC transporter permease PstA [Myxococcota bacterium]